MGRERDEKQRIETAARFPAGHGTVAAHARRRGEIPEYLQIPELLL